MQLLILFLHLFLSPSVNVVNSEISVSKIPLECLKLRKGMAVEKTRVVNTPDSFKKYFLEDISLSSCADENLKSFTIEHHTLVAFYETIAGCSSPKEIVNVYNKVDTTFVEITLEQEGVCEKNNTVYSWYMFPKQETSFIQFFVRKRTL